MNIAQNFRFRCLTLAICAPLTAVCVLVIANRTSSEPGIGTHPQHDPEKSARPFARPGYSPPRSAWSRLYPASDDCAAAKVDIWFEQGVATYSIFVPGAGTGGQRAVARVGGGTDGTTMLIGEKDCLIRIRVEQAPAGASIDN